MTERVYARDNCPKCGDIRLTADDIVLRPCVDDATQSSYHFVCPECGERIVKQAHPLIIDLLAPYVRLQPWFLPCELFELHQGPPISVDDVIDFHQALNP